MAVYPVGLVPSCMLGCDLAVLTGSRTAPCCMLDTEAPSWCMLSGDLLAGLSRHQQVSDPEQAKLTVSQPRCQTSRPSRMAEDSASCLESCGVACQLPAGPCTSQHVNDRMLVLHSRRHACPHSMVLHTEVASAADPGCAAYRLACEQP